MLNKCKRLCNVQHKKWKLENSEKQKRVQKQKPKE